MKHRKLAAVGAALALTSPALIVATQAPAAADPCFFGGTEFNNWYNGARWGDSLGHIEGTYANCVGAWESGNFGTWHGNTEKKRVWPRTDGGQSVIFFTFVNGAWRAHDEGNTGNLNVGGSTYERVCEFPRTGEEPCSNT